MGYQKDREDFIAIMFRKGFTRQLARTLLAKATTLQRLAVAECNEENPGARCYWPAGATETACGSGAPTGTGRLSLVTCFSCRGERILAIVRQKCVGTGIVPEGYGDPRGAVLRLRLPSGYDDRYGGLAVPTPNI